jgi:hypothetical protein
MTSPTSSFAAKRVLPTLSPSKKNVPGLSDRLLDLLSVTQQATPSASCALRLQQHLLGTLICPERSTLTNLICSYGGHQADWTADYRLYSRDRVDEGVLFDKVCSQLLNHLPAQAPLVVAVDDTILRKSGTHIAGVGWKRDPLGPAFQTNLVRAQRFVQFSAAWPLEQGQARMVPVGFHHAPSAPKPPKDADEQQLQAARESQKQQSLNQQTLRHLQALRQQVPEQRAIILNGDGSYTNKTILRGLPANCHYIGRMRKDALLHALPQGTAPAKGRPACYGERLPTPEELRRDLKTPWQRVRAFAAGKNHRFRIKTLGPVLWRKAGADLPLRIVVIAPLGYRRRKGVPLLYRQPAYLLCTDLDLPLKRILQYYLWRWGIEVNFREEKTLVGTGDAQVRTKASNQHLPAMTVAAYALLWTAALTGHATGQQLGTLSAPKWRQKQQKPGIVPSTGELIRLLRYEMWAESIRPESLSHFALGEPPGPKSQKLRPSLPAVLFAAA